EPGFSSKESLVIYSMKGDIDRLGVIGRDRWWLDDKARKAGGLIVCHQAGGEAPGRAQRIGLASREKVLAAATDLDGLLDGKSANLVLCASAVLSDGAKGRGIRGYGEQDKCIDQCGEDGYSIHDS